MEDRDDGIGSEINTPRNVELLEKRENSNQMNGTEVGHLIASYPPSSSPTSSTPIKPQGLELQLQLQGISPIHRTATATLNAQQMSDEGCDDLAVLLRNIQSKCIELESEKKYLADLMKEIRNENQQFQNQVTASRILASNLAIENEALMKMVKENESRHLECQHQLQMVQQKLTSMKNNYEQEAEIWKEKYATLEEDAKELHLQNIRLEDKLKVKQAVISELEAKEGICQDENCNKFKLFYETNVEKIAELHMELKVLEEKLGQSEGRNSKNVKVEEELKAKINSLEETQAESQKKKQELEKQIEELVDINYKMSAEKQTLLETSNKLLKDVALWQEKNRELTLQNSNYYTRIQHYESIDLKLNDCLDTLEKKNSLIEELNRQISERNSDLKRFRDEVFSLRALLSENAKTKEEMQKDWEVKKKLLEECKHLKETAQNCSLADQISSERQKNAELSKLLEKNQMELESIKDLRSEERKRVEHLEEEISNLKLENARLKISVDEINAEYSIFRNQAELQYQLETADLKQAIEEKDERLDRLHARIAMYESYPVSLLIGKSGVVSSTDSKNSLNITLWDALPATVRSELYELKEEMENKSTDCSGLLQLEQPETVYPSGLLQISCKSYESKSSISSSVESPNSAFYDVHVNDKNEIILVMLDSVRHTEIHGKLTPNIQQLLIILLTDVQEGNKSWEEISEAVNRFFANLDLALRKTLSASDDNRVKSEKLEEMYKKATHDFHDVRDELRSALNKCCIYEARIYSLELQLKCENQTCTELNKNLERSFQEIERLDKQISDLNAALSEAKMVAKYKTDLGMQTAGTIKCIKDELLVAKKSGDEMREFLRKLSKEKEEVKRLLSQRELDVVKLECRLVECTNECTIRGKELQCSEDKVVALQKQHDYLKQKCDKREGFLHEMQNLLIAMKIRCEGLQRTNQLRQNLIEKLKKLLVKLGCDLDDTRLMNEKIIFDYRMLKSRKKIKTGVRSPHLERLKLAKLAQRFKEDLTKIKELERIQEKDACIPECCSVKNSRSVSSFESQAEMGSVGVSTGISD